MRKRSGQPDDNNAGNHQVNMQDGSCIELMVLLGAKAHEASLQLDGGLFSLASEIGAPLRPKRLGALWDVM